MPNYLPEDRNPNWWEAGPWPPPLHQPFRSVVVPDVLSRAAEVYALTGLEPAPTRDALLSQMDELYHLVTGQVYGEALRALRERI